MNRARMFGIWMVALALMTGRAVLAADPVAANAAGQPKLQAGLAYDLFGSPAPYQRLTILHLRYSKLPYQYNP